MLRTSIQPFALFALLGIAVALASIYIMAIIMAIAIPSDFFGWFKEYGVLELGIFVLDVSMISATIGLLSIAILLAVYRFLLHATIASVIAFLLGVFVTRFAIVLSEGFWTLQDFFSLNWWNYGYEFSVATSALLAYLIARRTGPNNSFKPTPHRGVGHVPTLR